MEPVDLVNVLLSPEGRIDPYPLYEELRKHGPLVTVQPGYLVATSYEVVDASLRDSKLGVEDASLLLLQSSILNRNPPDHTRMRRLIAGAFTPRRINGLEQAITSQAEALADAMREKGESVDLMADFAYRLPVGVICELLGVPEKDREWFRPVASDFAVALEGTISPLELSAAESAAELLHAYFSELVRTRRGTPKDDLISDLAAAPDLAQDELLGNLALLLLAGFETTTNLIGNGVMTLLDHPSHLARLAAQPELAPAYVEEFLRFDSPVQLTSRVASEPSSLIGYDLEPGSWVMAARLEARIAFPLLLRRFPGLTLAGEPLRRNRLVLRGYESLPIAWT